MRWRELRETKSIGHMKRRLCLGSREPNRSSKLHETGLRHKGMPRLANRSPGTMQNFGSVEGLGPLEAGGALRLQLEVGLTLGMKEPHNVWQLLRPSNVLWMLYAE